MIAEEPNLSDMRPPDHPPPPDLDKSAFSVVPDEVIHIILGFLTADDLARASVTCRRLRLLGSNPRLWRRLLLIDFYISSLDFPSSIPPLPPNLPPPPPGLHPLPPPPSSSFSRLARPPPPPPALFNNGSLAYDLRQAKSSYLKRTKDLEKRKLERELERKRQQERELQNQCRRRLMKLIEVVNFKYIAPLFCVCALTTLGLIVKQMEEPNIDLRNWTNVFIPVFVFIGWIGVSICVGTFLYQKRLETNSVWGNVWDAHIGPASVWMIEVAAQYTGKRYERTIWAGYVLYLLIVVFAVLLALQASSTVAGLNWTISFIPLWIVGVLFVIVLVPSHKDSSAGAKTDFLLTFFILILPFFIVAILVPLYLDGDLVSALATVFTPLWIQDSIFYISLVGHTVTQLSTAGWDWKEIRSHLSFFVVHMAFFSPVAIFEILLCVAEALPGSISPSGLFSPLFFLLALIAVLSIWTACTSDEHPQADWSDIEANVHVGGGGGNRSGGNANHRHSNRIREIELSRGYGTRNLPVNSNHATTDLLRNSWAQSVNPQFEHASSVLRHHYTPGLWDNLPDFGFDLGDMDAVEGATLSDFHRMQLAISRALADMNQDDARAIVHSAASAVQHAAQMSSATSASSSTSRRGSTEGPRFEEEDEMILAETPRTPNMPPPLIEGDEENEEAEDEYGGDPLQQIELA